MNGDAHRHWGLGLALAVLWSSVLYIGTMGRHIGMGDTALLLNDIVHLHVNSHVNNHPVAVFLGWLVQFLPFGTPALKGNLLSALLGVASMSMMYAVAYHWLRRAPLALIATMFTSVIHTVWWHSTIVENYMVNAFLLLAAVRLMQKNSGESGPRYLYAASALGGLAFVNHTQMGFLAPALGLTLLLKPGFAWRSRGVEVAKLAAAWWVGMVPFLGLLLRDLMNQNWNTRVLYWTIGGDFTERMFDLKAGSLGTLIGTEALIQLPSVLLPLAVWGLWSIRGRREEWPLHAGLALGFVINTAFFLQFHTWDRFAFLMPSYLIITLWSVVGWSDLLQRFPGVNAQRALVLVGVSGIVSPPVVTLNMVEWGRNPGFWHRRYATSSTWNSHDVGQYVGTPTKHRWNDMDRFAKAIHKAVPDGSVIIDDDSRTHYPLQMYYQSMLGLRRDLKLIIINSWGFGGWGRNSAQLYELCTRRIEAGDDCLYVTTHFPMVESLGLLLDDGHRIERFDLDEDHWLYRVKAGPGTALPVRVLELETGTVFNAVPPVMTHRFGPDEPVRARLRVIREDELEPVEVDFVWTAPDGSEARTMATIQQKRPGAVSQLPQGRVVQGRWTVQAAIGDEIVGRANFRVEDAPARRRSVVSP